MNYTAKEASEITGSFIASSLDAFSGCSSLKSITIPSSVKTIESRAFAGCSGLTSLTIPNSVTSIGRDAFRFCNEAKFYVSSETTKQLLVNSGVSESQVIVSA